MSDYEHGAQPVVRDALTADQAFSDAAELQTSLGELAALVAGSQGLVELLGRVATSAARAIPGADGAGVTLLRVDRTENRVEALAASHPFVTEIDEIQYVVLNEGPCITAALEQRTVRSGSLGGEKIWPRFGPRVGRLGVHSALSLPMMLPGQLVGAINVYARKKDVFDEHAAELGELFAAPAAVAVHNAHILSQALALTAQLQAALATRPVIEQAIGLLRGRTGGTAEEAFARLRVISQGEHTKLAEVAQRIVDDAVRRARPAFRSIKSPNADPLPADRLGISPGERRFTRGTSPDTGPDPHPTVVLPVLRSAVQGSWHLDHAPGSPRRSSIHEVRPARRCRAEHAHPVPGRSDDRYCPDPGSAG